MARQKSKSDFPIKSHNCDTFEESILLDDIPFLNCFDDNQRYELIKGLDDGLEEKVLIYSNPEYDWKQMEQIRIGLKENLNVKYYLDPKFDYDQMREIRLGLKKNVNVKYYNKYYFSAKQMREIRLALEKNLDIKPLLDKRLTPYEMKQIRLKLQKEKRTQNKKQTRGGRCYEN